MANYNVDIAVALKGAKKLTAFSKDVRTTQLQVEGLNKSLKNAAKDQNLLVRSFENLNTVLSSAKANFNAVASGTSKQITAAKQLISAEKQLNKELLLRNRLLSGGQSAQSKRLPIDPVLKSIQRNSRKRTPIQQTKSEKTASSFLGFSQSADKILAEKIVSTKRQELELQEALLALEIKSAAKQNEKLQLIGEVNRQTAQAVNNARLRGQFSPLTSDVRGNIYDVKSRIEGNTLASRRAKFRNVFGGVSGRDFGQIGGRIGPVEPIRSEGGFLAFSKAADKIAAGVKANVKQTTKTASILSQQATRAAFEGMPFGVKDGQIGPAAPPTFFNRMGFGKNAQQGPFAMQGGAMGRLKGGVGSAMIGGGFPFLFGAGGLSAVMGAGAGAIGGALAPGGGFALSIAATAAAAQIEDAIKFRKELKLVNAQLQAVGNSSIFSRQEIKNFAKELNITKEEATQLVDSLVPRFTKKEADALINVFGKEGIGRFDEIAGATDAPKLINEIVKARDIIGQRKADELLADLKTKSNLEVQLKLTKEIGEVNRKNLLNTLKFNTKIDGKAFKKIIEEGDNLQNFIKQLDPNSELGKLFQKADPDRLANANLYSQLARAFGPGGAKFMKEIEPLFRKEFFDFIKPLDDSIAKTQQLTEFTKEYLLQLQEFEEFRAPVDEIEKLSRATRVVLDVSKELKTSFAESFKGIVKGTMTVTDAFRNMLNRIGDYFLDLAAQVLAAGIQKSFLGLFQNMFNVQMPSISGMADGGRVTGGRPYIVGERGPELFSPGVSGNITPNESLGGSTNIVVNVDASGSSVEGDEEQGRELGRMISVAIQSELIKQKRPGGMLA